MTYCIDRREGGIIPRLCHWKGIRGSFCRGRLIARGGLRGVEGRRCADAIFIEGEKEDNVDSESKER